MYSYEMIWQKKFKSQYLQKKRKMVWAEEGKKKFVLGGGGGGGGGDGWHLFISCYRHSQNSSDSSGTV